MEKENYLSVWALVTERWCDFLMGNVRETWLRSKNKSSVLHIIIRGTY